MPVSRAERGSPSPGADDDVRVDSTQVAKASSAPPRRSNRPSARPSRALHHRGLIHRPCAHGDACARPWRFASSLSMHESRFSGAHAGATTTTGGNASRQRRENEGVVTRMHQLRFGNARPPVDGGGMSPHASACAGSARSPAGPFPPAHDEPDAPSARVISRAGHPCRNEQVPIHLPWRSRPGRMIRHRVRGHHLAAPAFHQRRQTPPPRSGDACRRCRRRLFLRRFLRRPYGKRFSIRAASSRASGQSGRSDNFLHVSVFFLIPMPFSRGISGQSRLVFGKNLIKSNSFSPQRSTDLTENFLQKA